MENNPEKLRLQAADSSTAAWKKWGPYVSDRQWGTVREDYSEYGDAWNYFTHDQARSRAYRWGEDGIAGICDQNQYLCFALALWNGKDAILKERLFGLSNSEGNHGEDVKEYYYYLDNTPTHSWMKFLYKYPQQAFPYDDLAATNRHRNRNEMEYELIDTGIFDQNRYFDIFVEYAKESPEDILIRITAWNRGPDPATLHLLPTVWFRNTWSWPPRDPKPELRGMLTAGKRAVIASRHEVHGERYLYCENATRLLFTDNETNTERIFGTPNATPYVKDGINNYLALGEARAVNPADVGTKGAVWYQVDIPPQKAHTIRLRFTDVPLTDLRKAYPAADGDPFGNHFDEVLKSRQAEADAFYQSITPPSLGNDAASVMRQALAGMLWTKQFFLYDVHQWLTEHAVDPLASGGGGLIRNRHWYHMLNHDVISMPDKWEYPWYAAWDLAFHCISLAMVDTRFAKDQLDLMLHENYLHPNGQLPAYEWNFSDVNPPVHPFATYFVYQIDRERHGKPDMEFLKRSFQKLLMNFTWWVNRKDIAGKNVFQGGFLGLDNIGVFDRSMALPTGGHLEQADGTAWMALFCQNMLQISLEIAQHDPSWQDMALKFYEHFLWIASAIDHIGDRNQGMWDEEDGFFYDVLRLPDGQGVRMKVRSMVGLLPLCATTIISMDTLEKLPALADRAKWFTTNHPELFATIAPPNRPGFSGRRLLALLDELKLRRVLARMLDESEFFSPYGIRALSRAHAEHPFTFSWGRDLFRVDYEPAESSTAMFGGNSNWRGPIWFPVNALLIRALLQLYLYYGNDFTVECPTGSGRFMNLYQVSEELARRLASIFLRDDQGRRPVFGGASKFQEDPHWRDHLLFYEYFHGDNGAGLGASHQTGWTGLVARLIQMFATMHAEDALTTGTAAAVMYRGR